MSKLDLLLDGIREDSKKEADHILANANKRSEEIKKESKADSDKEVKKIIDNAEKDAKRIIENSKVTSEREARDIKIRAKNELVDDILDKLLEKLRKLGPNDYKKFVENRLKEIDVNNGEILLQKDMKYHFDENSFNGLRLSKESVDEGFVVRSGKISYDNRYSSLLNYDRDNLEKIIADRIFK